MPHLALPVLTAYLRSHGVEVVQRDLNMETYDTILSRAYLEQALDRLHVDYPGANGKSIPRQVRWAFEQGPQLANQIERAKAVFHSPAFYDGEKSFEAFGSIVQSLELASLPHYPAQLDLLTYAPALPVDNSRNLIQLVSDPRRNMFLDMFKRIILPDIERERPDIVGISIPAIGQMLAGMTLAHLVKQSGLNCHVTVGGPHISMLREQIPQVPSLFNLIDSAIVFDGEISLLRLAEALDSHHSLANVPNLIYKTDDKIRLNAICLQGAKRERMAPDFSGLDLKRYLVPEPVLPLMTAQGCYHGLCGFCNVGYGGGKGFYPLPVDQVLEQIATLQQKYGAHHIFFADEAITPRTLRLFSEQLIAQGLQVNWCGCVRFEHALSQDLLETISHGGGRMLLFGLETASERMIEHIVKGTRRETMSRILKESTLASIWNHTFFFFGFPTETMEDAQDTVNFVYAHQDSIHSAAPGEFVLERYSPVYLNPARFGVKRIIEKPEQDLAIYFDYEPESGIDEAMAHTLTERLLDVLPTKRFPQFYVHDVYRFLYVSFLRRQGQGLPLWLADD